MYLLDEELELVPWGARGELYIGGAGLARGYWKRSGLTAERFVPDQCSGREGERLYRTGDIGRYRKDGSIEFLGRRDEQVKIRGYRIELGEIENVLVGCGGVKQAVVTADGESGESEKRLIAYLVGEAGAELKEREIRKYLQDRLPEYMVPVGYVVVPEIPLTANGKVDRKKLPRPEWEGVGEGGKRKGEPGNQVEQILCGIWREVLRTGSVGVEDNFFQIGGHSLLATQVILRIRQTFSIDLAVRTIFESPTIRQLAEKVMQNRSDAEGALLPPMHKADRNSELPLSFAQQRLWFLDQLDKGSPVYNMPYALHLQGELNRQALQLALNEIVRRHEVLRTSFELVDGIPKQKIADHLALHLGEIDLRMMRETLRDEQVQEFIENEATTGFDLSSGPLLRLQLLQTRESEFILLCTLHHIISDGWSIGILIRELRILYAAFCANEASPLQELEIQYVDFSVWQREWLQGEIWQKQMEYWKNRLARIQPLNLPLDHSRVDLHRGGTVNLTLSQDHTAALKELCQHEGVTLFMTMLSVFSIVLGRVASQDDIIIGTDVAGRDHVATENLIGFFVNQLVLRVDLGGTPTVREILHRVRETTLDALAHQYVPFEKLVDEISPARTLARTPIFQVKMVLQNTPRESFSMPGLTLGSLPVEDRWSKFDMLLNLRDSDNGIVGWNQFDSGILDRSTVNTWMAQFTAGLQILATNAGAINWPLKEYVEASERMARTLLEQAAAPALKNRKGQVLASSA